MLNFDEAALKNAIAIEAADRILREGDDLSGMIRKEVDARLNRIFAERATAQIQAVIDETVRAGFDREYQRVTSWGEVDGPKTSIRKELDKVVSGYWNAKVDTKTGKPSSTDYNSTTRAEFLMTSICADDFSEAMKSSVQNVTGALKDGLRNQMAKQMDNMLDGLFRIKSLQDQGKVEKPY